MLIIVELHQWRKRKAVPNEIGQTLEACRSLHIKVQSLLYSGMQHVQVPELCCTVNAYCGFWHDTWQIQCAQQHSHQVQ